MRSSRSPPPPLLRHNGWRRAAEAGVAAFRADPAAAAAASTAGVRPRVSCRGIRRRYYFSPKANQQAKVGRRRRRHHCWASRAAMAPRQAKKLMVLLGCAGIWRVQNRQLFSPTYRGKSKCVLPFHTSYDGEETWDYYESILWLAKMVKAIVADVMLVYLPAPTVGLKPPLARNASAIAKFFSSCPDNAFQIALAGRSFTLVQRLGAFVRNAIKLLAVGTTASFIGTSFTNTVLKAKAAVNKDLEDEVVEIPVLQTSVAYGVYMSISSNLMYQLLAGVIEQRMLEPLLHNQKLLLSVMSFIVRTGNTFLGSLLWIDYARWIGIQKAHDHEEA